MTQYPPGMQMDDPFFGPTPPPKKKKRTLLIVLAILGGAVVLGCLGCVGFFAYFADDIPDTFVYAANETPANFVDIARDVGALDDDESILFFYSDAFLDIRDGFYLVTDRRVVIYEQDEAAPMTSIPFDDITSATLTRNTSFVMDSTITLFLDDGTPIAFPVSSDMDRDILVHEAIESRLD